MIVESLAIQDFLSIAKANVQFPRVGLVLVSGWNETWGRANGAGKSALMQALCWCLYGEFPRDVKVDEIIRRGQASCKVTTSFDIDGTKWVVTRKRPSGLEVVVSGVKQVGNPKFLQSMIEIAIGFNYKQFLVTSFFPQKGDSSRFLKQTDTAAKEFLGNVLNFSKADSAYKKLHNECKDLEVQLAGASSNANTLKDSLERLQSLANMVIPPPPNKADVLSVKAELDLVELKLKSPPDTSDVDARIAKIKVKKSAVEQLNVRIATTQSKIREQQNYLSRVGSPDDLRYMTCPSCSEKLLDNAGELVTFDEEHALEVVDQKKADIQAKIEELKNQLEGYNQLSAREGNVFDQWETLLSERSTLSQEYQVATQRRETLRAYLASFKQMFEAHKGARDQVNAVQSQITSAAAAYESSRRELLAIESQLMETAAAKAVLSPTGAIAYSLDSVIDQINEEVTQYLDIFSHGTMAYRMSSGEDKAKIVHHVTYETSEVSVGSLSGGEERGLILSVDLGLSEVLAKRCGHPLPSILMLDECFDGLDYVGKEKVLDALREISRDRCIIVIDHSTEMSALFDVKIAVTKRGDISEVNVL